MQPCQVTFLDQFHRVFEHRFGLGRETGDDVGTKGHVGTQGAGLLGETDRVVA